MKTADETGRDRFNAITLYGCIQSSVREMRQSVKAGHKREGIETLRSVVREVYRPMIKKAKVPRSAWLWAMNTND